MCHELSHTLLAVWCLPPTVCLADLPAHHTQHIRQSPRRQLGCFYRYGYREAGMSEDAIQAMYEFDLGVLNSERAYITNTLTVSDTTDDSTATETSDFKQYEKAITVTDTYHETKTRFTWVGEIQNERLHAGLEKLSDEELQLVTLYFHEKYSTVELSKVYGIAQQNISKRILKITKFLKNFDFQGVE